jgi:hypothetical protein
MLSWLIQEIGLPGDPELGNLADSSRYYLGDGKEYPPEFFITFGYRCDLLKPEAVV